MERQETGEPLHNNLRTIDRHGGSIDRNSPGTGTVIDTFFGN